MAKVKGTFQELDISRKQPIYGMSTIAGIRIKRDHSPGFGNWAEDITEEPGSGVTLNRWGGYRRKEKVMMKVSGFFIPPK